VRIDILKVRVNSTAGTVVTLCKSVVNPTEHLERFVYFDHISGIVTQKDLD